MKLSWFLGVLGFLTIVLLVMQHNRTPYVLPKQIWTHWDTPTLPENVSKNIEHWKKLNPDWNITLVTTDAFLASLNQEEIPPGFGTLQVQHQADWIRMKLLKVHGGCWMDSGILLNQSINNLYRDCASTKADLLVFKILGFQTNPQYPIAENWFIMAPPQSPMITLWLEEYERAIKMGFKRYKERMKQEGVDFQKLMPKPDDVYLTQHLCYQKVIQQRISTPKVVYHAAEDTMFKVHAKICKWDKPCIWKTLKDVKTCKAIPYIKLRVGDRKHVDILPLLE